MSKICFSRKPDTYHRFSDQERRRLQKVSDAKAEAQALADPENPPLTDQQLDLMALARAMRLVREKTG